MPQARQFTPNGQSCMTGRIAWSASRSPHTQTAADEIIRINTRARHLALQVALLIPFLAALLGFFNSFRIMRLPDPRPSSATEGMGLG
jgi:hypothetical protein